MVDIAAQAEFFRAGGYTRRYNGQRTLNIDYVGMHQNNVTNLVLLLRPECRKELVVACARHDSPEWASVMGDIPSPIKRRVPGLKEASDDEERRVWAAVGLPDPCEALTPAEYYALKLADYFDGMMFCIQERQMGNTLMSTAFKNFTDYIAALMRQAWVDRTEDTSVEHRLWETLQSKWIMAGGS